MWVIRLLKKLFERKKKYEVIVTKKDKDFIDLFKQKNIFYPYYNRRYYFFHNLKPSSVKVGNKFKKENIDFLITRLYYNTDTIIAERYKD